MRAVKMGMEGGSTEAIPIEEVMRMRLLAISR